MKLRIALILLVITLLVIVPVYAQETTAEPTTSAEIQPETRPVAGVAEEGEGDQVVGNGATTLVLLLGLAAIVVVGGGFYLRQSPRPAQE